MVPFKQLGQGKVSLLVLVLTIIFVLVPFDVDVLSQGTIEISLGDNIKEGTIDLDEDGSYEYLLINIDLLVYIPGSYGLHGDMGQSVTANTGPFDLGIGSHEMELRFSGGAISRSSLAGHLQVEIEAYSRDPTVGSRTGSFITEGIYGSSMFEPPSGGTGTEVSIIGDEVVLSGPIMEVRMNKTDPELSFSYSGDVGKDTRAYVRYLEVIAYNDLDDDQRWDPDIDELRYRTDLDDVDWELGTDFSKGYHITLYGILQLELAGTSTVAAWAKMTFSISSEHMDMEGPSQKFDIDIDLWQPLDAERIAVRHEIVDRTGKLDLVEGEVTEDNEHAITVMKGKDRAYGTYSWTDEVQVGRTGPTDEVIAKSWFDIQASSASVWFSYPLGEDTQIIHHDPTMSMDPEIPANENEDEFLVNRPILMMGGSIVGIIVITGTIFMRRRMGMKGPGDDDHGTKGGD